MCKYTYINSVVTTWWKMVYFSEEMQFDTAKEYCQAENIIKIKLTHWLSVKIATQVWATWQRSL